MYTHNTHYVYNDRVHITYSSPVATHECSATTTKAPYTESRMEKICAPLPVPPPPRRECATSETPSANHRPKKPGKEKASLLYCSALLATQSAPPPPPPFPSCGRPACGGRPPTSPCCCCCCPQHRHRLLCYSLAGKKLQISGFFLCLLGSL